MPMDEAGKLVRPVGGIADKGESTLGKPVNHEGQQLAHPFGGRLVPSAVFGVERRRTIQNHQDRQGPRARTERVDYRVGVLSLQDQRGQSPIQSQTEPATGRQQAVITAGVSAAQLGSHGAQQIAHGATTGRQDGRQGKDRETPVR